MEELKVISDTGRFIAIGRSGKGGRKENQDCYGGYLTSHANLILTVCDGMGGAVGGQTASYLAVEAILKTLSEDTSSQNIPSLITQAIDNANQAIYQRAVQEPSLRGMGTTATIMVINREAAWLTHVGDSRIYQLRKGKKVFRTFDHSKVFEMVAQGMMTEEQARQSSFSNIITKALGIKPKVDEIKVEKLAYRKGDRMILCCDGVWNTLPEPEMLLHFCKYADTKKEITHLTDMVNQHGIDEGNHHDNLTAIIVDMKQDSDYQISFWDNLVARMKKCFKSNAAKAVIVAGLLSLSLPADAQRARRLASKSQPAGAKKAEWKAEWIVSPGTYGSIRFFAPGMYRVERDGKVGMIDKTGKEILAPKYDAINLFYEGRAIFVEGTSNGWLIKGVLSEDGSVVYANGEYYAVEDYMIFSEGSLPVRDANGRYGYLDEELRPLFLPFIKEKVTPFSEGMAAVGEGDDFCWITTEGEKVWIKLPNTAYPYGGTNIGGDEGNYYAWDDSGRCYVIGSDGKAEKLPKGAIIPDLDFLYRAGTNLGNEAPYTTYQQEFDSLWTPIEVNGSWTYKNNNTNQALSAIYDRAEGFTDGVALASVGGKTGMMHITGFAPVPTPDPIIPNDTIAEIEPQKPIIAKPISKLIASLRVRNGTADPQNRCYVSATVKNPNGVPVTTTVTLSGGGTTAKFTNKTVTITIPAHSSKTVTSSFFVKKVEMKGWCSVSTKDGKKSLNFELAPF